MPGQRIKNVLKIVDVLKTSVDDLFKNEIFSFSKFIFMKLPTRIILTSGRRRN